MLFLEWKSQRHCIVIDLFPLYITNCNFIIAFIVLILKEKYLILCERGEQNKRRGPER